MKTNLLVLAGLLCLTSFTFRSTVDVHRRVDGRSIVPESTIPAATVPAPTVLDSIIAVQDSVKLPEDVIRTPSSIGEVEFPHLEHTDDFDVACNECHHEVNATALDIPHEAYFEDFWIDCKTCHTGDDPATAEAMSCSGCHHDRPSRISDETLSVKVVIHKNCWNCHEVGTGPEASQECSLCHSGPRKPYVPVTLDSAQ